jgi:hypothetical protein
MDKVFSGSQFLGVNLSILIIADVNGRQGKEHIHLYCNSNNS